MNPVPAAVSSEAPRLRDSYTRKLSQVQLAPCAHIAVVLSAGQKAGTVGLFEHHAVMDVAAREVIHYWRGEGEDTNRVQVTSLEDFEAIFGSWRVVALPKSLQQGQQVLERARSRLGEAEYGLVTNNCEHFATWCFEEAACSSQVWSLGANVATSTKGGIVAGVAAASATTTVTTPWYFLGIIPWGATTATVPAFSTAAAVGIGAAAFVGWVGVGLGIGYGMSKWWEARQSEISEFVPIAIFNISGGEIVVELENVDSSSGYYSSRVDDLVHETRAYLGVGQRRLTLGPGIAGELNPPAEDWLFQRFRLRVWKRRESLLSVWPSYEELASAVARRGDVLLYRGAALEQLPDPEPASPKGSA